MKKAKIISEINSLNSSINSFMSQPSEYKSKEDILLIDYERFTKEEKNKIIAFKESKIKEVVAYANKMDFDKQQSNNKEQIKRRDFLEKELLKLLS